MCLLIDQEKNYSLGHIDLALDPKYSTKQNNSE